MAWLMKMEIVYSLFVPGLPKAQPRPRMTLSGHVYNPDTAKDWKATIKDYFMIYRKPVIINPVVLGVLFFFPRPKRLLNYELYPHTSKPDSDNLLKAVMDAMTDAGVWKDDAQVYGHNAEKYYSQSPSGVRIIVKARSD
jgi:Holliday junction resolvase RusA-like endonuclease